MVSFLFAGPIAASSGRLQPRGRESSKHALAKRRVQVFPELHDLAVGEPADQAVVVVVADARRSSAIFSAEFSRTIDLVISIGNAFKGFHRQLLYSDRDALAVRRGHPVGGKLARREIFLKARHVAVIIRGQNEDLIDGWLRAKGIERRIALVVPGYLEALHIVARTDLVAFVPGRLIAALAKPLSLKLVTPPLDPRH